MLRFIFLLSILVTPLITCLQNVQDTKYLQQNERYILKLDDYYKFAATKIDFPQDQPEENIRVPYTEIGSQNEGSKVQSITGFQDSLSSKYLIGYNIIENETSGDDDLQIIYFHIEIVQGVLTKTQLASKVLLSSINKKFKITASFYSLRDGFISYQSDKLYGNFHFSYIQNSGLTIKSLQYKEYFGQQVAMQGQTNIIYIIYVSFESAHLLKYQAGGDSLQAIDTKTIKGIASQNIVADTTNIIIGYDSLNKILYNFSIDYTQEKLIVSELFVSQIDGYYTIQSLQRFKDNLILTLNNRISQDGNVYVNLSYYKFANEDNISVNSIVKTKLFFIQIPIFIDYNILVFYNSKSFQMINIEKQQVIFQQNLDENHTFDPQQYIGNQFIIDLTKQDDQGKVKYLNYAVQLQLPSMVIIGANQLLVFDVYQIDQSYFLRIEVAINIDKGLITTFTSQLIQLQNTITSLSDSTYYIPLEKYIIGSNFDPSISVSRNNCIDKVQLNRLETLKQITSVTINNIQNIYQTDGLFSSIIVSQSGQFYSISAAAPKIDDQRGEVFLYSSKFQPLSAIGIIDNYGSFILQSDLGTHQFTIYIPFIVSNQYLHYNTYTTDCDVKNFAFASDTQNNVFFVMCDKTILQLNYQFNSDVAGQLLITSKKDLLFDASQYQKLICIQGNLFIYNDQSIAAYDYLVNDFIGSPIEIPKLQANQQITLFSQNFIISYNYQQKLTIQLFSYNQFLNQGGKAVFVRYLIQDQPSQDNLSLIPKRNKIEYLLVSTSLDYQYSLFRINKAYSQNQFYTTVTIASDQSNLPIISQDAICIIGSKPVQCQQILNQAALTYQLDISQNNFNSQLKFQSLITLQIEDKQQVINLNIARNASTKYGSVNQQAASIVKLKADLQDNNFIDGTTFYFDDQDVFSACILGWQTINTDAEIINRLSIQDTKVQSYVFTILYNQKAVLQPNQIILGNNLLIIKEDFTQNCFTILDDSASKVILNPQSFQENIYVLCQSKLYKYSIEFTSDKTGALSQAVLLDQSSLQLVNPYYPLQFKRIVSYETKLWLYDFSKNTQYFIEKIDGQDSFQVQSSKIFLTSVLSFNVISSLNLELSFYSNGLINVKNVKDSKNIQYFYYNLQDLLLSFNFIVDESDYITSIYQYSDTKFRIQYAQSFIYDITFDLDPFSQLTVESAKLYYYQDVFKEFQVGITGDKYTLLFGKVKGQISVALYNRQSYNNNLYLIKSAYIIIQKDTNNLEEVTITYAEQVSQNQFIIYQANGYSSKINISDSVGIKIINREFQKSQIIIHPYLLTDQKYQISLSISPYNPTPTPSPSSQTRALFYLNIFILLYSFLV